MKTALVLSGGGAKGAFQLGALEVLDDHNYTYDTIAGVSVGALNGIMTAAGNLNRLAEIWRTITPDQVYRKRSLVEMARGYLLHWLGLRKPPLGIYSNKPLHKLIQRETKDLQFNIPITVGRVGLKSGAYLNEVDTASPDFDEQILASTAIPVIWDPVKIEGNYFVDGGIRNITPLKDVIREDPDRIVVITTEPRDKPPSAKKIKTIADIAERAIGIMLDEIFDEDLKRCMQINHLVRQAEKQGTQLFARDGHRLKAYDLLLIEPEETLGSGLDFERKRLDQLIEKGRQAAIRQIARIA